MAMERQYIIRETHTRSLTAVGYNPARREILVGCEDGVIKTFEAENGKLVTIFHEHKGWVTDFLYWSDTKLLISSANDGELIAWSSGGGTSDRVQIGMPVYCMIINPRRFQLVCGVNGGIRVYALDPEREGGHFIKKKLLYFAREHTDIVRCILCIDSRIYSAGYDQRLVIYDSSYTGDYSLDPIFNNIIHDAGITCMICARDNENNTWILTGSFDKSMKIWSIDGKLVNKIENFLGTVTGLCYIPRNKTVWVAGGAPYAWLYDPKSGDNVSDFIGTFQNLDDEGKYHLQVLRFFPETNVTVATTSRRQVIVWKYNTQGCVTALKCTTALESLCYTAKIPILIFSADHDGLISKWERMQSNPFMYSKEVFIMNDTRKKKHAGTRIREQLEGHEPLPVMDSQNATPPKSRNSVRSAASSNYSYRQSMPPVSAHDHQNTTILKLLFVESMDLLLAASEDSNIYVWGFDDNAVQVLQSMRPADVDTLVQKYAILLDPKSQLLPQNSISKESDSVTNRVAGFVCKCVLSEHYSCVTSMVLVGRDQGQESTYLLSGGWDRRICIWDLETLSLKDLAHTNQKGAGTTGYQEIMCDGIITSLAYSPRLSEFAVASSDKMAYVRKFNPNGQRMILVNTLQGHDADVTAVEWNPIHNKWVTGSEDGTVRIWNGYGMNECEQILNVNKAVSCLCVDICVGCIVVATQNNIRVYDPEFYRLVQSNLGHVDSVRSVIHVPERGQYVSCSWDKTIRVWNAWKMPRKKNQQAQHKDKLKGRRDSKRLSIKPSEDAGPSAETTMSKTVTENSMSVSKTAADNSLSVSKTATAEFSTSVVEV